MLEIKEQEKYFTLYDSIYDFSEYLINKQRKPGREDASDKKGGDFCGTDSFEEAMDLMLYGDEEIYKKILKNKKKLNVDKILGNATRRAKYEQRNYGCIPNVPLYLTGSPINMINREINNISHKIINIMLDVTVPWHVDKDIILENGILYLTVIDLLEKAGYRCNLYAGCSTEFDADNKNNLESYMLVRVKTDREPLNLKKICFTIANPSMLRRMHFRWAEVNDFQYDCTHDGYGHFTSEKTIVKDLTNFMKDNIIVWSYKHDDDKSLESIIKDLEKKGIKLSE